MASSTPRVFLLIRAPNGDIREVPLGLTPVVLGRDDSADVRVEDKKVSRRHAAFKLIDGEPWVEDLGSQNGVKLNGKRVDKRARFMPKDKVKVGAYEVTIRHADEPISFQLGKTAAPPPLESEETPDGAPLLPLRPQREESADALVAPVLEALDDPVKGKRFVLQRGENIIGRLEDCSVPVLDASVSRQHVRVVFSRDRLSISDLGSSNGTFVNEVRVEMAQLVNGDVLRVGNIRFNVILPDLLDSSDESDPELVVDGEKKNPYLRAAVTVLFLAIGVAAGGGYWRWKQGSSLLESSGLAPVADAPDAAALVAEAPDSGEVERTIEPVTPEDLSRKKDGGKAGDRRDPKAIEKAPEKGPEHLGEKGPEHLGEKGPERLVEKGPERLVEKGPKDPDVIAEKGPAKQAPDSAPTPAVAGQAVRDVAAVPEEPAEVAGSETATAPSAPEPRVPYGPRDQLGLPLDLPKVDESFDFDAFVAEKLAAAKAAQAVGDVVKSRDALTELLGRDPINQEARAMLADIATRTSADQALAEADTLIARSEWAQALKVYASIPASAPQSGTARAKIRELKGKALEQELARAEQDAREKKTLLKAHQRYRDVLELEPGSDRARTGLRAVERKMRARGIKFAAYVMGAGTSTSAGGLDAGRPNVSDRDDDKIDPAIVAFYSGDETLARIASLYAKGALQKALKRAEAAEKKLDGPKRESAKALGERLRTLSGLAERVRNESANDPSAAWSRLTDLEHVEEGVLPKTMKSMVRQDLEESLAEAFAVLGASLFDRGLFDEAFERWNSGLKLDPKNPKVLAGLAKLEEKARSLYEEAEIAAQRGERDVCARWRSISRITRGDAEVHKKAIERAKLVCR